MPNYDLSVGSLDVQNALDQAEKSLGGETSWLDYRSPRVARNRENWAEIDAHLTGGIVDAKTLDKLLVQRSQGENRKAFLERKRIADYTPIYARSIVSLVGMGFMNEAEAEKRYVDDKGRGLGDPFDEDSDFWPIYNDVDGSGKNWDAMIFEAATYLASMHGVWGLVEGEEFEGEGDDAFYVGGPYVRVVNPRFVPRFTMRDGRLYSVRIISTADKSIDQKQKPNEETIHTIYYADGYEKFKKPKRGKEPIQIRPKTPYADGFEYVDRRGNPAPPVWWTPLNVSSNVGYLMARKATALFNQESSLDFLLWVACFPKLFADVVRQDGTFDAEHWEMLKKALKEGSSVIPGARSSFGAPPMETASVKHDILKDKRKDFLENFFISFGDAARERTATEIRQESKAGTAAYLGRHISAVDEFENNALWFLSQAVNPRDQEAWSVPYVNRKKDFDPTDVDKQIQNLINRHTQGGYIPVDEETLVDIAVKSLEKEGVVVDDKRLESLKASVLEFSASETQSRSLNRSFFGTAA